MARGLPHRVNSGIMTRFRLCWIDVATSDMLHRAARGHRPRNIETDPHYSGHTAIETVKTIASSMKFPLCAKN